MWYTTLNQIKAHRPCAPRWEKGLRLLGKRAPDDEPVAIVDVLDAMGLKDALWCLRAVEGRKRDIRLLAVAFASEVKHLMVDPWSHKALEVATAFANGLATEEELAAARGAARTAAYAAWAAADAADADADDDAAAWAADAAWAAAYADDDDAAWADAYAAAWAADAAWAAARSAMRVRQAEILREFCTR